METLTTLAFIVAGTLLVWKAPELQRWLRDTTKHPMFGEPVFLWWFRLSGIAVVVAMVSRLVWPWFW